MANELILICRRQPQEPDAVSRAPIGACCLGGVASSLSRRLARPELYWSGEGQTRQFRRWSPRLRSLAREPSVAPPQGFLFEVGTSKRTLQRRYPLIPRWFPLDLLRRGKRVFWRATPR